MRGSTPTGRASSSPSSVFQSPSLGPPSPFFPRARPPKSGGGGGGGRGRNTTAQKARLEKEEGEERGRCCSVVRNTTHSSSSSSLPKAFSFHRTFLLFATFSSRGCSEEILSHSSTLPVRRAVGYGFALGFGERAAIEDEAPKTQQWDGRTDGRKPSSPSPL